MTIQADHGPCPLSGPADTSTPADESGAAPDPGMASGRNQVSGPITRAGNSSDAPSGPADNAGAIPCPATGLVPKPESRPEPKPAEGSGSWPADGPETRPGADGGDTGAGGAGVEADGADSGTGGEDVEAGSRRGRGAGTAGGGGSSAGRGATNGAPDTGASGVFGRHARIARSVVCTSNWWPSSLSQPPSLRCVSASRLRADTSSHCSSPTSTRRSVAASQATSAGDICGIRSASTAWMRADS